MGAFHVLHFLLSVKAFNDDLLPYTSSRRKNMPSNTLQVLGLIDIKEILTPFVNGLFFMTNTRNNFVP